MKKIEAGQVNNREKNRKFWFLTSCINSFSMDHLSPKSREQVMEPQPLCPSPRLYSQHQHEKARDPFTLWSIFTHLYPSSAYTTICLRHQD